MKKLIITTTLLLGSYSWGQNNNTTSNTNRADGGIGDYRDTLSEEAYTHGVTLGGGMSVGQPAFSLDYEYRLSNHFGIGAYGNYSARKGINRPGIAAGGIDFKAHVSLHSVDLYVRPGMGIAYFDDTSKRTAVFAPIFATGLSIRVARNFAVGVEHFQLFNWTSSDVTNKTEALLATVQVRF